MRRIASHRDTLPRDDLHPLLSRRITCSNTSNVATTSSDTFRSHHPHGDQHSTNNNPLCTRAARPRRAGHHVIQVSIPPFPIPNPGHRLDTTPPTPTNPPPPLDSPPQPSTNATPATTSSKATPAPAPPPAPRPPAPVASTPPAMAGTMPLPLTG